MVDSRFIKSIAQRFDIETARHPNKLRRLRWRVTCCAAVLTFLIIFGNLALSGDAIFQSRPVTSSHASLANNCKQCHDASFQLPRRLLGSTDALFIHSCQRCHEEKSMADHHGAPNDSSSITDCASCHSEHRGQTSLTNVSDSQCVSCHSDLSASAEHHPTTFANSVKSIDSHPEIALLKQWANSRPKSAHGVHQVAQLDGENGKFLDASNIKFNHSVHLRENGVLVPPDHPDYGRTNQGGLTTTTLDCTSCHVPDEIGQGMQPIKYEQHCASCHQLSYSSLLSNTPLASNKPLPHVDPELINGILRDRLINYRKQQNGPTATEPDQQDDFGATRNPAKNPPDPDNQSNWDWVESHLPNIQARLFAGGTTAGHGDLQNGCALCHSFDRQQTTDTDESIINWSLRASNIADKWLSHSKFPHARHTQTSCVECHYTIATESGDTISAKQSVRAVDILIPSIKQCQSCHTDERKQTPAFARGRCVHCHDYHNDHAAGHKLILGNP
jgi:hypothetical protein